MPLAPGTQLGPYKIVAALGAGGMGEVYRARDPRLGREVALKVIPLEVTRDRELVKRFEQEALAAGSLNHPNVIIVYDVGAHDGSPFVVMELLEGRTLRERMNEGSIPVAKVVEYAAQAARGLAAAHHKGIVHRDVKPENLFVTRDGRVKVLDFGLAKLTRPEVAAASLENSAAMVVTQSGAILGTVAYMAPEQAMGHIVDQRADIFALGVSLYEMLAGKRPFAGATYVEILNAILHHEPARFSSLGRKVEPGLETLVSRCLEKDPNQRFASAHDVVLALEVVASSLGAAPIASQRTRPRATVGARNRIPSFTRITFRRGTVGSARFSPDGYGVFYSARWGEDASDVYSQRLASTEARPLGLAGAQVAATSGGEIAVVLGNHCLARMPLEGGTPREIAEHVVAADWTRDGTRFVVVREVEGRQLLECPIGKVLVQTDGLERMEDPRVSPQGDRIAFVECPNGLVDASGDIAVVDLSGKKRILSKGWLDVGGVAWSADGREIWFTATKLGMTRELHAVTLTGRERLVARLAANLVLQDIARDGRVLLIQAQRRSELRGRMAGDADERDLSWLDGTKTPILSNDGTRMVFQEYGEGGGPLSATYFRRMDGSPPVRLADGTAYDVSPDWQWVLIGYGLGLGTELRAVPIGPGESKVLPRGSISGYHWGVWHPNGKQIVILGNEAGRPERLFVQELPDGLPRAFGPEGVSAFGATFSPDGRSLTARPPGPRVPYVLVPLEGGEPRAIPGLEIEDEPVASSEDGGSLFAMTGFRAAIPAGIVQIDVATGERRPWLQLKPLDRIGVSHIDFAWITPNGRYYAYQYARILSDLYLGEGLG